VRDTSCRSSAILSAPTSGNRPASAPYMFLQ
jgi:hypothetical protein